MHQILGSVSTYQAAVEAHQPMLSKSVIVGYGREDEKVINLCKVQVSYREQLCVIIWPHRRSGVPLQPCCPSPGHTRTDSRMSCWRRTGRYWPSWSSAQDPLRQRTDLSRSHRHRKKCVSKSTINTFYCVMSIGLYNNVIKIETRQV